MKRTTLALFISLVAAASSLADDSTPAMNTTTNVNPLANEWQRDSYALGMMVGHNWQQQGVAVDFDLFERGFKDAQSGGPMLMTPQEMQATIAAYQKEIAAKQEQMREMLAAENEKKGQEYLAENKNNPGVKVLPDGLEYKIISAGKGTRPGSNDVVLVNYRGTLLDGTEFDSTATRGQPSQFPLNRIIPGWREALQLMNAGSVWQLYIPSELAYGKSGHPPQIPPNSTLIFDVQLISSSPPGAAQTIPINPALTSDIIAVPSAAELKKGKQPYTLKPAEVQEMQRQFQKTNSAPAQ